MSESNTKYRKIYPSLPQQQEYFEEDSDSSKSNKEDKDNKADKLSFICFLGYHFYKFLFLIIIAFSIIFIILLMPEIYKRIKYNKISKVLYNKEFEELRKEEFPSLSEGSYKIINTTIFHHIFSVSEPVKPAVINLIGDQDGIEKLISGLSTVLTRSSISAECTKFTNIDQTTATTDKMKLHIYDFINSARKKGSLCIYVPSLDKITPSLGPYLHGLTDEITATFKDVIYIFTIITKQQHDTTPAITSASVERMMISVLSAAWLDEMEEERFAALMSRLAINVVLVK